MQLTDGEDLQNTILNAPIGICLLNADTLVAEIVNDKFLEIAGKPYGDIYGKFYWDAFAEARPYYEAALADVVQSGEAYHADEVELMLVRHGREEMIFVTFVYSPVKDKAGKVVKVAVWVLENTKQVSDRLAVEAARSAFQRERDRLKSFFMQAPAGICILGGPELIFELVNPAYQQLLPGRKLLGRPIFEALPELTGTPLQKVLLDVYRTGQSYEVSELLIPVAAYEGGPTQDRYFSFNYQARLDENDQVDGVLTFVFEVTGMIKVQHELEEAREQSERQKRVYETIASGTPDLMYVFSLDYRFTYVNSALLSMWGKTWEDAIGKGLLENGYEPWHAEMHEREIDQVRATKQPVRGEVSFPHATLGTRVYDYILTPVLNEEGEVEAVAGTTRDVTERKQWEQALRQSSEELQAINEEMAAINEEQAVANEEYQATNEELLHTRDQMEKSGRLFRAIARNIPGSLVMVIGPDHKVLTLEGDLLGRLNYDGADHDGRRLYEVGSPERFIANRDLYDRVLGGEQFRIVRKGDGGADYQLDFVPLRDDSANVYAGLIIALDITEIKQAEEKSAKLAAIVESSDDAIISKTLDGTITSWNSAAERIFGYTAAEMIGQSILKLIPEDRKDEEPQIIARIKQGERVDHYETKRMTSEGKLIDFSLTISPVRDAEGVITGVSKIARDISEKKQDEVRKNDFIGMVSHELKTPLTTLTAIMQVLKAKLKNSDDAFVPGALDKANLQVQRMIAMINGFLNISRLESGKILIEKQAFNMGGLLQEMIDESQMTVTTHRIELDSCGDVEVYADRDKISSVISNLVSNAVKYSPKGKTVQVKCQATDSSVTVSVTDEGMGIKPADLQKVFDRYYRVETTHTQRISGFGIGLYLSAEIVQRHDGKIWAESESGVGSAFYFSLPLK